MYDPERGWSLSFAGCGFLGFYHVGATLCLSERAPHLLRDARTFFGCSAGALHVVTFLCSLPLGAFTATTQAPCWEGLSIWGIGDTFRETCPDSSHPSRCRGARREISEGGRQRARYASETLEHLLPAPVPWFEMGPAPGSCQLGHPGSGENKVQVSMQGAGSSGPCHQGRGRFVLLSLWLMYHGGCCQEGRRYLDLNTFGGSSALWSS